MTKCLYLRLSGPLQSWGHNSLFWNRGTGIFPTKSGVIGLMFCALGKGGEQREALAELSSLPQKVLRIGRAENVDQALILTDFHLVGAGYDKEDSWQNRLIPSRDDGKKADNGGVRLTRREYLQQVNFVVFQEIPDCWTDEVANAFLEPCWDIYLGRKSCAPSLPVFGGIFENEDEAMEFLHKEMQEVYGPDALVLYSWEESSVDVLGAEVIRDVPVAFGRNKQYSERAVLMKSWPTENVIPKNA